MKATWFFCLISPLKTWFHLYLCNSTFQSNLHAVQYGNWKPALRFSTTHTQGGFLFLGEVKHGFLCFLLRMWALLLANVRLLKLAPSSRHRVRDLLLISAQVWEVPHIAVPAHGQGPLGSLLLFRCPQAASFLLVIQASYTSESHVFSVEKGALEELESCSHDISQTG